jgi:hypothetical protein
MKTEALHGLTFEQLQAAAQAARNDAKTTRVKWRSTHGGGRDAAFARPVAALDQVIAELEERLQNAEGGSLREQDLLTEAGDCYGVKGGTYRDWGRYLEAARSYETGRGCEERLNELSEKPNSYCLVQHLVNLILADPASFAQCGQVEKFNVTAGLARARDTIRDQMKVKRKGDPWAQADLALVSQLLGDDATHEWDTLDDLKPKRFVYDATHDTVLPLFEKLKPHLSDRAQQSWIDVIDRLS